MNNLKNDSSNRKKNFSYLLGVFFLVLSLLVGWWIWECIDDWQWKKNLFPNSEEIEKSKKDLSFSDINNLSEINARKEKLIRKKLEKGIYDHSKLGKKKVAKIKKILSEKNTNDEIFWWVTLDKINNYLFTTKSLNEQIEKQNKWINEILPKKITEIEQKLNDVITFFFKQALENSTKLWGMKDEWEEEKKWINPTIFEGEEINANNLDKVKRAKEYFEKNHKTEISKSSGRYFLGYRGFTTEKDIEESKEDKITLGITKCKNYPERISNGVNGNVYNSRNKGTYLCSLIKCKIKIKLKMELMFLLEGCYEEWITYKLENGKYYSSDISLETMIETIAHELAHAIINYLAIDSKTIGLDKGGHGVFHDNLTKKIKEMINNSPKGEEFKNWIEKNND